MLQNKFYYRYYRPQRSWGKVMFSQASVILFTEGVCIPACTGAEPPSPRQTFPEQTDIPLGRHFPGRHLPPGRHPPGQTPPRWPLQRTVRILLKCILVHNVNTDFLHHSEPKIFLKISTKSFYWQLWIRILLRVHHFTLKVFILNWRLFLY